MKFFTNLQIAKFTRSYPKIPCKFLSKSSISLICLAIVASNHVVNDVFGDTMSDKKQYQLVIEKNRFNPEIIEVEADKAFELIIENRDKTVEEFESDSLKKEKLIGGGKTVKIKINPLKAGEYSFFGEFHPKTAKGKIVAK